MVEFVENAQGGEFWRLWADNGGPFEITLFNLHIQARKLETVDTLYSKYQVLETEREMIRFGMGKSFPGVRPWLRPYPFSVSISWD
jgi:hypothetical protein